MSIDERVLSELLVGKMEKVRVLESDLRVVSVLYVDAVAKNIKLTERLENRTVNIAQGFNPAADCSPFLTQCPRCNNPNGGPCDGGPAAQLVALTVDEKAALDRALLRSVKFVGDATQPQQEAT